MRLILVVSTLAVAAVALAADTGRSSRADVDANAVLDRLEKRLLDQESETRTFSDKSASGAAKPVDRSYALKGARVEGQTDEAAKLRQLGTAIGELEKQVDVLGSEVQRSRQKVLEEASLNNSVEIEAALTDHEHAALRALSVRLDGFDLYRIDDGSDLWLPSQKFALYAGPLPPGNHKVELTARLAMKQKTGMPLNSDVFRSVTQSFTLAVPDGNFRKRWLIELQAQGGAEGQGVATLK